MSIVFMTQRPEEPQDRVAIKILVPPDIATSDEFASFQARFLREAQAAHRLHHPHILPVLDFGEEEDGLFYMVMPLMTGGTLAHRLAEEQGSMPLDEVAGYLNQLASAVDYANQRGMIHRDIKPSNVLLDEEGNVYLADFGIVHLFDTGAVDEAPTALTTTGKMYGTPAYMAPERYRGEPAEPATDIYALGVLLYQLVTGQVPFTADNPLTVGVKHLTEEPPRPRSLRPDLPEPAEAAILKALAKQPADRFASASALADAFDAGLRGQWVEGLLPLPPVLAASLAETQVQQSSQGPGPVIPIPGGAPQPDRLVLGPAARIPGGNVPLAFAPTSANAPAPATAPPRSRSRGNPWLFALIALAAVLLLLGGLLAFELYRAGAPTAPAPGNQPVPAGTQSLPTRTGATPTPSSGATLTPSPGNASTATPIPSPTPTRTPTPSPSPSPSPTPSPSPPPTPTTIPLPTRVPTPGGTPPKGT